MSTFELEFPILVEQSKDEYHLSPLLFSGLTMSAPRYANAIKFYQKCIRSQYKNKDLEREDIESLLWYRFSPDLVFDVERFVFRSGMHYIDGDFAIVYYSVGDHKYACFPRLGHHTFRLELKEKGRSALLNYLTEKLIAYFQSKKKIQGDEFEIGTQFSPKSTSTAMLTVQIEIKEAKFNFEKEEASFFAFFSDDIVFDGAQELEKVAEDLAQASERGLEKGLYREREAQWLEKVLFSDHAQAAVLVAPEGIGKSNLVEHVYSNYLSQRQAMPTDKLQRVWRLDPLRVISGMSIVGQWERRFETILCRVRDRIRQNSKQTLTDILLITNPVALMRVGKTSQTELTLAHLLIPYIERREFPVILTATPEEWQKVQDLNRRFADLFQVQRLAPLQAHQVDEVVSYRRAQFERQYECEFSIAALLALSKSEPALRGTRELPGSLIHMLRSIAITSQNRLVDEEHIYHALQENYHINKNVFDHNKALMRREVDSYFQENLIGQPHVNDILADTILSIKARLCSRGKPLNTLLFIGPTGVGKTEAAKLLARFLFTKEESLVRIDMNEFIDEAAVDRLIGGDYNPYGILTEQVRYQKSCVVLLDEIEKAHARVHDILLQLLDDGRLTDAAGNTIDFSQTIVIMTSNVGAQEASSHIGFVESDKNKNASYLKSLERSFRPEMINRINNIVVFNNLDRHSMKFLAKLHLQKLLRRDGFIRRNTILNIDEPCLNYVADRGFEPGLGARSLKRNLEKVITFSVAEQLAEADSDEPIVLNMWLEKGTVCSDIVRLGYADRDSISIPSTVSYDLGGYKKLHAQLLGIDGLLSKNSDSSDSQSYIRWTLLDAVRNIHEPLQSFIFELEDRSAVKNLNMVFSFKSSPPKYFESLRRPRVDFGSLHAHHDIRSFMDDLYAKAEHFFVIDKGNEYELWNNANRLIHAARCYNQRGADAGYLLIQSLVSHKGRDAVTFLAGAYHQIVSELGHMDVQSEHGDGTVFNVSGPGIKEFLQNESGVHLLYGENDIQVPIVVRYYDSSYGENIEQSVLNDKRRCLVDGCLDILRVYSLGNNAKEAGTVTDVRSGMMMDSRLGEHWCAIAATAIPDYVEID